MKTATYHYGADEKYKTLCGRPIEEGGKVKVLLASPKRDPKNGTVCGRCKALKVGAEKKAARPGVRNKKVVEAPTTPEKEAACRICGCTETNACEGGCSWVEPDLCSNPKCLESAKKKPSKRQPALLVLGDRMPKNLVVTFKGQDFTASVLADGRIHSNNTSETFNSPSRAGKAIAGREVDGWTFWSYLKADGTREKLDALRKAAA